VSIPAEVVRNAAAKRVCAEARPLDEEEEGDEKVQVEVENEADDDEEHEESSNKSEKSKLVKVSGSKNKEAKEQPVPKDRSKKKKEAKLKKLQNNSIKSFFVTGAASPKMKAHASPSLAKGNERELLVVGETALNDGEKIEGIEEVLEVDEEEKEEDEEKEANQARQESVEENKEDTAVEETMEKEKENGTAARKERMEKRSEQKANKKASPKPKASKKKGDFPPELLSKLCEIVLDICASGEKKGKIISNFMDWLEDSDSEADCSKTAISRQVKLMVDNVKKEGDSRMRWWLKEEFKAHVANEKVEAFNEKMQKIFTDVGKSKKASAPPLADLTEVEETEIRSFQDQFDKLVKSGNETLLKGTCELLEDGPEPPSFTSTDGTEFLTTLASHVQGSCETLSILVERLKGVFSGVNQEALEQEVKIVAERKAYGVKQKDALDESDIAEESLRRWEVLNKSYLPKKAVQKLSSNRSSLTDIGKRLKCLNRLLSLLRTNHGEKNEEKIVKEKSLLEKYLREDELKRQKFEERRVKEEQRLETKKEKEREKEELKKKKESEKRKNIGVPLTELWGKAKASSPSSIEGAQAEIAFSMPNENQTASLQETERAKKAMRMKMEEMDSKLSASEPFTLKALIVEHFVPARQSLDKGNEVANVEIVNGKLDDTALANKCRRKLFHFGENRRPPYFGTFRKKSATISGRRPFAKEPALDYEVDSDAEWQDEPEDGESLAESDGKSEDGAPNEHELDYQDGWLLADDVVEYESAQSDDEDDDLEDAEVDKDGKRFRKRRRVVPESCGERYAVGIVYDSNRIESGDQEDLATNLKRCKIHLFPIDEQHEPESIKPPTLQEVEEELLTKKSINDAKKAAEKEGKKKQREGQEAAAAASAFVTTNQNVSQGGENAGNTAGTKEMPVCNPLETFPGAHIGNVARAVHRETLPLGKIVDAAHHALTEKLALEFASQPQGDHKKPLEKPPTKKAIKELVKAITERIKVPGNPKVTWIVKEDILKKHTPKLASGFVSPTSKRKAESELASEPKKQKQ